MNKDILLLHGALGAAEQVEVMSNKFGVCRVWCPDLPGHGDHAGMPFKMHNMATALMGYINENQIATPIVFGYSMGGYLALKLESLYPGTVDRIVTLGTKFAWSESTAEDEASRLEAILLQQEKAAGFISMLRRRHGQNWERVILETGNMMRGLGKSASEDHKAFSRVKCPVKLLLGKLDKMVTVEETQLVANRIPNAQLLLLEGVKHPFESLHEAVSDQIVEILLAK